MAWEIQLYESPNGQKPVEDFIKSLQPSTIAKLAHQFKLLEEFGPRLGMPNAKPLGSGLIELRVRGKEEVRTLFIFHKANAIVVLHGFKKKTFTISKRDLSIAMQRKKEIADI